MTIDTVLNVLLWCAVMNYGVLLLWVLLFTQAHDWMYRWHCRWFRLSTEQFDGIHYALIGLFKLGIFLFNLVPYVALRIVA
jgi:hypothetical protein